ncbi:probable WRKY transcription factor 2 [Rutidosis leptorrhynchoides]|uniref:probable WRKY transcription factor 2 n=1 Tax=Rutidosis leptorrhynchoides TaxID=125765 RepID=UPI003A99BEAB
MGGFDDHVNVIGDWMPPSPSPRTFFKDMLSEANSKSVSEPPKLDNLTSGFTFPGPDTQSWSANGDQATKRSGLVERMAARAGYNAPRLNTDIIKPSADVEKQSFVTIPPGLSPTSFLDSPVFLSNSLAQPSPTTGKFPFPLNGKSSMMFSDSSDRNNDKLYQDFNGASFAFKPVPESAPVSREVNPPFMSWQSENRVPENRAVNANFHEHREVDEDQITNGDNGDNGNNVNSDDGYNWRKYGQKQVKGSEYPRSYYKCTHTNCPVKKKVERSHEGHITEIIYKGAHNHPKPPPNRRSGIGSSIDVQGDGDWGHDGNNLEVVSSTMLHQGQNGTPFESSDVVDGSTTFSNDEEEDDRATHGSVSLGGDGEGDESESKRRKVETYAADVSGASRAIREPRVVVQTTSEVDILDDGYRWRKYGQKVVKGNPNPRSYYKCTSTGCSVRKHVERASHDLKSVITTYEGKHNHDVPAARNSSHANSTIANNSQAQSFQSQNMARFERPHYGLQQGPHGYGYGMNLGQMGGMGLNQGKMPVHQYVGQMNEIGMMVPKGEPKVEPVTDPGFNLVNGSSAYHHQIMNRMPLG